MTNLNFLIEVLEPQMPIYLNQKPQELSPFWRGLFVCILLAIGNSAFAQIVISENTTLSIGENAYIYTESREVSGDHNAIIVNKDDGILLVSNSTAFRKAPKQTNPKPQKKSLERTSQKTIAKTEKPQQKERVCEITSQPASEKFSSAGAESTLAVVNNHYRELAFANHTFFIKKQILNKENPVFGRNIHSENNPFQAAPKTRPPPLSFRA